VLSLLPSRIAPMFHVRTAPSRTLVLFLLFLFTPVVLFAQAQSPDTCLQETVVVNARDKQGKFIDGLQRASFRALLSNQPVKIQSSTVGTKPPRIVVLLDTSGSMNRANRNLQKAQFLAGNLVASKATPHVALVLFSGRIIDSLGFDRSQNEILHRIASLGDGQGPTALYDSLAYSMSLFPEPETGDAIYLISDGGDNHSKLHENDAGRKLLERGIRLFSFILGDRQFITTEGQNGIEDITHLSEVTGGSVVSAWQDQSVKESERLNAQLTHAYDVMTRFYELGVELPAELNRGHGWELQVLDGSGKKRKDIEVSYPRSLFPCFANTPTLSHVPVAK
jgi:hypothetical protein